MGKLKITLFAAILFLISSSNSCEAKGGRGGGRGRGRGGSVGGGQGKTLRPKTCSYHQFMEKNLRQSCQKIPE